MFPRRLALVLVLISLSTGCNTTEDVPAPDVTPPVIDGRLDDACWTGALHLADFTKPGTDAAPGQPIEAWVTCGADAIYVAAKCAAADPSKIKADITAENDNVWQDDAVEVFIRTGNDYLEYDQFIVNSISTRGWHRVRGQPVAEGWKPAFAAKGVVSEDAWTAEFAIPLSDLGIASLKPDDVFQLKIGRSDPRGGATSWPPGSRYAGPDDYATLLVQAGDRPLRVVSVKTPDVVGPAIPVVSGETTVVKKLLVTDCRAVRGFIGAPVDGTTASWGWDARPYEYNGRRSSAGVVYNYRHNDGLHVTLADAEGISAIQVRGGARTKVYRDCPSWEGPEGGTLVTTLPGGTRGTSRAWFDKPVKTRALSFFDTTDGYLADVSFFRVTQDTSALPEPVREKPEVLEVSGPGSTTRMLSLPLKVETPLAAVGIDVHVTTVVEAAHEPIPIRIRMIDPVDARRDLFVVDVDVRGVGRAHVILDFPDQVVPAGAKIEIVLEGLTNVSFTDPALDLYKVTREAAAPEALAYRKLLLHGMYCAMSEPRPWNGWFFRDKVDEWFASKNQWVPCVRNILDALDHCRYIDVAGADDDVRQYYEWIWRGVLRKEGKTPPFETRFDRVEGAPEWATLARQAWLQARAVPKWWLDHRLVPTGEFGGEVGDDTDMYQNYADFVMFETDGVAAELKDAAARLAELAQKNTMTEGINRRTMDPLHAYEEGLNHDALLAFWNYGDPVYLERCMDSARSVERCTVVTAKGHRHFRSQEIGADRRDDAHTDVDGHAHPLMWHPTFEVVRYNANPTALGWLRQWADGWLEHMKPGEYAASVNVADETVAKADKVPFPGAYGGQGSAFESMFFATGDAKYLAPFMDVYRGEENFRTSPDGMVAELFQRGVLDALDRDAKPLLQSDPVAWAQTTGDKAPLIDKLKSDITELQRYGKLYTTVEPFTDRVFLYPITVAAKCYTGGFATRNKYSRSHAVSWEGLGTDYAALVVTCRPNRFKAIVYNFADRELKGRMRMWTLDHGKYQLTFGRNATADGVTTNVTGPVTVEVARATPVDVVLPPKQVTVIELVQTEKLDDVRERADLALSPLDTVVKAGVVESVAHNIGAKDAPAIVALVDAEGKVRQRKVLGTLAAPIDLVPKRAAFRFEGLPADVAGWAVVIDPEDKVKEIYEGNNRVPLP